MREALNILGFGPCHHVYEVIQNPEQRDRWRAPAADGPADREDLFEGNASCVDWPQAHFWRDLVAAYPEARVILTRSSPESSWESFSRTILRSMTGPGDPASLGRR